MLCSLNFRVLSHMPLRRLQLSASFAHLGAEYERLVQRVLEMEFKTTLERVGGAGDNGIDIIGNVALSGQEYNLITQCKLKQHGLIPASVIRELDGTVSQRPNKCVGVIASNHLLTPQALETFTKSKFPLIFMQIPNCPRGCESIRAIYANRVFKALFPTINPIKRRSPRGDSITLNLSQ